MARSVIRKRRDRRPWPPPGTNPTDAWQPGESRDYHVALDITPGEPDVPMQACQVSAVLIEPSGITRELASEAIQVVWAAEPGPINPRVTR